jgi:hypothetical protein
MEVLLWLSSRAPATAADRGVGVAGAIAAIVMFGAPRSDRPRWRRRGHHRGTCRAEIDPTAAIAQLAALIRETGGVMRG